MFSKPTWTGKAAYPAANNNAMSAIAALKRGENPFTPELLEERQEQ